MANTDQAVATRRKVSPVRAALILAVSAAVLAAAGSSSKSAVPPAGRSSKPAASSSNSPGTSSGLVVAPDLAQRVARFKRVRMPFNSQGFSARELRMIDKLVDASGL